MVLVVEDFFHGNGKGMRYSSIMGFEYLWVFDNLEGR